jgi:hypothetical protein
MTHRAKAMMHKEVCRIQGPMVIAGNERGVALILALVMLVLLTILGAMVLDTSSTELKIAGNFRNTQTAFYCADAGLGYASNPNTLISSFSGTMGTVDGAAAVSPVLSVGTCTVQVKTTLLGRGSLPSGAVYDQDLTQMDPVTGKSVPRFYGLYFAMKSDGRGAMNTDVAVEAGVAQVVGN